MSYKILSKFIKDISFEIPSAQVFVMLEKEIKKYNLNFDIKSKQFKENIIEVNTVLKLIPGDDVKNKMMTEINLTALVSLEKKFKDKKELEKIILCDVQVKIYPNLEKTLLDLLHNSGYPGIKFEKKVDFEALYKQKSN